MISKLIILKIFILISTSLWSRIDTIIIDPGHGGKDPGAVEKSLGLKEKHVNLAIAIHLKKLIHQKIPWLKVYMTRSRDKYLTLNDRVKLVESLSGRKAIFVSIHTNSHNRPVKVEGIEVFYYKSNSSEIEKSRKTVIQARYIGNFSDFLKNPLTKMINQKLKADSKILAIHVAKGLKMASKEPIRRISSYPFYVVSYSILPSILVEVGFISSKKFLGKYYQKRIAKGILLGILSFIKLEDKY